MKCLGYKVRYGNWLFLFIAPVFGALFFNYYGNVYLFYNKAWGMPGFYIALAGNYIVLLITSYISFVATLVLDRIFSWFAGFHKRFLLQIIFACLISGWIGNRIALIYVYFFDTYIGEEHYRVFIFPLMYLYLIFVSEIFGIQYALAIDRRQKEDTP